MHLVIFSVYFLVGGVLGALVMVRRLEVAGRRTGGAAILMIVLWPFLLPVALVKETGPQRAAVPGRIEVLEAQIREASDRAGIVVIGPRERALVLGYVERLRAAELRAREIEGAVATAPASARPRLDRLRTESLSEVEQGIELLEEILGRLTVMRFLDQRSLAADDRDRVVALVDMIGSITAELDGDTARWERSALGIVSD